MILQACIRADRALFIWNDLAWGERVSWLWLGTCAVIGRLAWLCLTLIIYCIARWFDPLPFSGPWLLCLLQKLCFVSLVFLKCLLPQRLEIYCLNWFSCSLVCLFFANHTLSPLIVLDLFLIWIPQNLIILISPYSRLLAGWCLLILRRLFRAAFRY